MNHFKKFSIVIALLGSSLIAHAQYDSTTYQGLTVGIQSANNSSVGTGVPDPTQLDAVTTYTETEVEACPTTGGAGYGYYPNGPVPADGTDVNTSTVQGGVIEERTVTVDRFGTTTYGTWQTVNTLCTEIPPPPTCPNNQTEAAPPYWDWGSDSWLGLSCVDSVSPTTQEAACVTAWDNYYNIALQSDIKIYGNAYLNYYSNHVLPSSTLTGPTNETGISLWQQAITDYENIGWIYTGDFAYTGSIPSDTTSNDVIYDGAAYACFLQPNTNTVTGLAATGWCSPNGGAVSCGGGGVGN